MLKFQTFDDDSVLQVILEGDLDIEGTEVINDDLTPLLMKSQNVNLNFEKVPFVDSSGMGLLINLVNTVRENNTVITISNINQDVKEVFELLQLSEILGEDVFVD